MKTELTDVTETQKTISIEIPTDVVDAEFDRVARGYTKQARLPGFRPGKVPQTLIKQRFRADSPRRHARAHSPSRRRGAPDARHRAGRHTRCSRSGPGRRTAVEVHRRLRNSAGLRSRRSLVDHAAQRRRGVSDEDVDDMLRRLRERAANTKRSTDAPSPTTTPWHST